MNAREDAPSRRREAPGASSGIGSPVVAVRGLTKSYGNRPILREVSVSVRRGERVALMGPSGSGKTTLLNCLGGVDRPDHGSIEVAGQKLEGLDSDELALMRRRTIGTVFQFFHLLPTLSAFENIELPLQLLGVPWAERQRRVGELVRRIGLDHRLHARPGQLSGGEQQRVAIARALVHQPAVLLADEPTGNLDSAHGARVLELLRDLSNETGTALLLVTHSDEATRICHRVVRMRDGMVEDSDGTSV